MLRGPARSLLCRGQPLERVGHLRGALARSARTLDPLLLALERGDRELVLRVALRHRLPRVVLNARLLQGLDLLLVGCAALGPRGRCRRLVGAAALEGALPLSERGAARGVQLGLHLWRRRLQVRRRLRGRRGAHDALRDSPLWPLDLAHGNGCTAGRSLHGRDAAALSSSGGWGREAGVRRLGSAPRRRFARCPWSHVARRACPMSCCRSPRSSSRRGRRPPPPPPTPEPVASRSRLPAPLLSGPQARLPAAWAEAQAPVPRRALRRRARCRAPLRPHRAQAPPRALRPSAQLARAQGLARPPQASARQGRPRRRSCWSNGARLSCLGPSRVARQARRPAHQAAGLRAPIQL